jgi:hypothetical protein
MLSIGINAISTMRWLFLERETGGRRKWPKEDANIDQPL